MLNTPSGIPLRCAALDRCDHRAGGRDVEAFADVVAATVHQRRFGRQVGFVDQGLYRHVRQPFGHVPGTVAAWKYAPAPSR